MKTVNPHYHLQKNSGNKQYTKILQIKLEFVYTRRQKKIFFGTYVTISATVTAANTRNRTPPT